MEPPYSEIKIVNSAKIHGHMCTTNTNINSSIYDRLNNGEDAWCKVRRSSLTDKNINNKIKINFPNSPIRTILTYGIVPFKYSSDSIGKMQSFYSKCIREISYGIDNYKNEIKYTNEQIRITNKIPTIQSY